MFLIWGKSSKIIKTYPDSAFTCVNCNSRDISYVVKQYYFHFFWIPVFPLLKTVGNYCNNCQYSNEEIYSTTALMYEKQTKTPLLMYSWTIIFVTIMSYIVLN